MTVEAMSTAFFFFSFSFFAALAAARSAHERWRSSGCGCAAPTIVDMALAVVAALPAPLTPDTTDAFFLPSTTLSERSSIAVAVAVEKLLERAAVGDDADDAVPPPAAVAVVAPPLTAGEGSEGAIGARASAGAWFAPQPLMLLMFPIIVLMPSLRSGEGSIPSEFPISVERRRLRGSRRGEAEEMLEGTFEDADAKGEEAEDSAEDKGGPCCCCC